MNDWRTLATTEAYRQDITADIVLATVDAETQGRNILGDSGNAVGYGQVWPLWHRDSFDNAAQLLGLTIPQDIEELKTFTLNNDQFSMAVAVNCIKQYWRQANGNWDDFTYAYVGSGITNADFQRRKAIWEEYNSNPVTTRSPAYLIPATNYQIDPSSLRAGDALYGRRYRVLVRADGDNAFDVSKLRCTFRISKVFAQEPNYSEITIYNLNANTENTLIREGNRIILEAGYEGNQYGLIFDGDVIQPIREKEDGVTYKLTLVSLDGDRFLNGGLVNFSMARGQSLRGAAEQCAAMALQPAELESISESLGQAQLTRGKAVFGLARDYLRQLAQSSNATFYVNDNKVNIVRMEDLPEGEIIELSPSSGLIGVPAQSEYGVTAKCLLNPRININSFVHIDNSLIRARQQLIGQPIRMLDYDGIYRVIKVTHIGDTRGDEWYTEIETVTQSGLTPSMLTAPGINSW